MRPAVIAGAAAAAIAIAAVAIGCISFPHLIVDTRAQPFDVPALPGPRVRYPASSLPVLTTADGQRRVVRSVLNVPHRMKYGDYVWNDDGIPAGPAWVRIDLTAQTLSLFRGGHEIGAAVILYGTDNKPTPTGVFRILERAERHRSTLYDAEMPYMLRLTPDGVAIHASNVRRGSATHGCIGLPEPFARRLFATVRRGSVVAIEQRGAPPATGTRSNAD